MSSADGVAETSFVGSDTGTAEMTTHASGYSESDPLVEGERAGERGHVTAEHEGETWGLLGFL